MLPPDNFQEDPAPVVAHRTSPTNIGLYLLSTASAHDFGWLGLADTVERLEATLGDHGQTRALPGPFLQLVRHARPAPARSAICVVGRQRQSGGTPHRARQCLRGMAATSPRRARLQGIGDALDLMAEELDCCATGATWRPSPGGSSTTPSRRWRPTHASPSGRPQGSPISSTSLAAAADTLVDITSAFTLERGDGASSDMLFWARAVRASIASHQRDLAGPAPPPRTCRPACSAIAATARDMALAMDFEFLLDPQRMLLSIGFLVAGRHARTRVATICWRRRRGSPATSAIAKGDLPTRHWFRLGHDVTPVDRQRGADLVVGVDVRISDAVAGHAHADRQRARADEPHDRPTADRVREEPRHALGRLGVGLQHPRPGIDLPVFQFRRAGPGSEARARRQRRGRALCDGAGSHSGSDRGGAKLRAAGRRWRPRRDTASSRRWTTPRRTGAAGPDRRGGPRLHGPPSGHDRSSPSPTPCWTAPCAAASTPNR